MERAATRHDRQGFLAAIVVVAFAIAYAVVLSLGLASLPRSDAAIGDPWFTMMEILIVAMMPALVMLMAAIQASAPSAARRRGRWALGFMIAAAVLTGAVHLTLLVLRRVLPIDERSHALLGFEWPSLPYALDMLAWDVLFAISVLLAAPLFGGSPLRRAIRDALTISGVLALAGLAGPLLGDMRLRNIGVVGYAVVFPVAAALLALHFRRASAIEAH